MQVIIDHVGTKLHVEAFRAHRSKQQDARLIPPKIIHASWPFSERRISGYRVNSPRQFQRSSNVFHGVLEFTKHNDSLLRYRVDDLQEEGELRVITG